MPKLQASGDPATVYGIHNTMSNTGNFGSVADNQLSTVVQRVEAAVMAEMMPSDPMKMEEAGVRKEDGNESLNPDGTLRANAMAGFDGKTQIPQINQSVSIPGMNRTPVGDKWAPGGNVMENRENGAPIMSSQIPAHMDMLLQQLISRGFVLNEIGQMGGGQHRLEHKMGQSIARTKPNNERLEIEVTDRIGRPVLVTDRWDQLDAFLNENYPQDDS